MGIPDEDVARVRASTDIVALIGEHVALKRVGRRWSGLCPFHAEKTASFSVNAEEGFYYCFGCQAKGDAISFVRAIDHLDFVDAVRRLADKSGITIHEDANAGRASQRRKLFMDAMESAAQWYHERLLTGADAGQARDYLRSRGYDGSVVRRFGLGWAPDDWDALCRALKLSEEVAVGAGLGFVNRRGRLQDAFRGRVLFPICDSSGRPVALGGRVLPGSSDPAKYKNSQESVIYSKRKVLYGLNWAKADIIKSDEVVVCEGYTDVIGFFEAGVERAVATCGTAMADEHFGVLRNFAKRVVLAYDADGAGQAAAGRFYEWERRHEIDVAVADLPAGADPGELSRSDPDALRAAIEGAKPFLQFRVERVLSAADLSTQKAGPRRPMPPCRPSPSTLMTWSGTSTSCRWRNGAGWSRRRCGTGSSVSVERGRRNRWPNGVARRTGQAPMMLPRGSVIRTTRGTGESPTATRTAPRPRTEVGGSGPRRRRSGPASRCSVSPSIDPRTWPTGSSRCCSATSSSGVRC